MEINDEQKELLLNVTKELKSKLSIIIGSLDELCRLLGECEIDSYYTRTIRERMSESKIRAAMANTRTDEFIDEIKFGIISMEGFY